MTAVDLFCGSGGLSRGLVAAGFNVLAAVDWWQPAINTYKQNFVHPAFQADIRQLSSSELLTRIGMPDAQIDLIAGGPPCQGFSIQRIGSDDDARNDLIFEFARFVRELKPRMFLMENVPGLLGKRGLPFAKRFEELLEEVGYSVRKIRINTAEYGLPQIRKRIFYYGWSENVEQEFTFPHSVRLPAAFQTVSQAIGDLPTAADSRIEADIDPLHWAMRVSPLNLQRLKLIPAGGGFEDLPVEMRVNCHKAGASKIGHRNVYGRLDPDKPAVTVTARFDSFTRGKFAHPHENRNITLREGARLQTFPDTFQFVGSQEEITALIGNAIPPMMAEIVAKAIYSHLARKSSERTLPVTTI
jgi:DNA (cytosine-5)-methyltransferase 1